MADGPFNIFNLKCKISINLILFEMCSVFSVHSSHIYRECWFCNNVWSQIEITAIIDLSKLIFGIDSDQVVISNNNLTSSFKLIMNENQIYYQTNGTKTKIQRNDYISHSNVSTVDWLIFKVIAVVAFNLHIRWRNYCAVFLIINFDIVKMKCIQYSVLYVGTSTFSSLITIQKDFQLSAVYFHLIGHPMPNWRKNNCYNCIDSNWTYQIKRLLQSQSNE